MASLVLILYAVLMSVVGWSLLNAVLYLTIFPLICVLIWNRLSVGRYFAVVFLTLVLLDSVGGAVIMYQTFGEPPLRSTLDAGITSITLVIIVYLIFAKYDAPKGDA